MTLACHPISHVRHTSSGIAPTFSSATASTGLPPDLLDLEMAADLSAEQHGRLARTALSLPPSLVAVAACGGATLALTSLPAPMAPLKVLLAQGLASHGGCVAAFLGAARLLQPSEATPPPALVAGAAGAALAGLSVNLLGDTTGMAIRLGLRTGAAVSLAAFASSMLTQQIIDGSRGRTVVLPIFLWAMILALCRASQGLEEAQVAAFLQQSRGAVPFIPANENAIYGYITSTAGMAVGGATFGFLGIQQRRVAACAVGAVLAGYPSSRRLLHCWQPPAASTEVVTALPCNRNCLYDLPGDYHGHLRPRRLNQRWPLSTVQAGPKAFMITRPFSRNRRCGPPHSHLRWTCRSYLD